MSRLGGIGKLSWVFSDHPAHPEDRLALIEMTEEERFIIWAIRQWVDDYKRGNVCKLLLIEGFHQVGAARAIVPFNTFMKITAEHGVRNLDVRCHRCGGVGEGEIDILSAIYGAQTGRWKVVGARLASWLDPSVQTAAELCIDEMMDGLAEGRLKVDERAQYTELQWT